jgi:hypothetical protein
MCAKRYLQCVVCGRIYMAHESCQQRSKGYAPQPRPRTVAAIRSAAGCRHADAEGFRPLSSSSLSLSAAGPAPEASGARWRCQGCVHGQALPKISAASSHLRQAHGFVIERNRKPSIAGGLAAEKKAWLNGLHSTAMSFITNIVSIVCSLKNSNKFTNFLCPKSAVRSDQRN